MRPALTGSDLCSALHAVTTDGKGLHQKGFLVTATVSVLAWLEMWQNRMLQHQIY